jgi:predicted GH43/DUF377 family glycosyl hydrolase
MQEFEVLGAFNPGATIYGDEVLLLLRVAERVQQVEGRVRTPIYRFEGGQARPDVMEFDPEDPEVVLRDTRGVSYRGREYLSTISHIRLARSQDGVHFSVEEDPFIYPEDPLEQYGVEDARVTFIHGAYYINYTAVSRGSWATALAKTTDFETIDRLGLIFHPENKDVAIFPEKVGDNFVALHRPNNSGFGKPTIWYAESPDLLHWGNHQLLIHPRDSTWESMKIGGGAPPIKTPEGWLVIYHGKGDGSRYSLLSLLLDLEDPTKVIHRAEDPLLYPTEEYEVSGFFGNVVFSNGLVERDGELFIYYGAADESSCLAVANVDALLGSF